MDCCTIFSANVRGKSTQVSFYITILTVDRVVEVNVGIIVACSSTLPKFYTSAKAFTSSIYQSFTNRTSRLDSLSEKSKISSVEGNSNIMMKNDVGGVDSASHADQKGHFPTISSSNESVYQVAQPILRTDSYTVAYNQ